MALVFHHSVTKHIHVHCSTFLSLPSKKHGYMEFMEIKYEMERASSRWDIMVEIQMQ
jgi:hypothetical protein